MMWFAFPANAETYLFSAGGCRNNFISNLLEFYNNYYESNSMQFVSQFMNFKQKMQIESKFHLSVSKYQKIPRSEDYFVEFEAV